MTDLLVQTEQSRAVLERFYACISSGNIEGAIECMDENIEVHEPECLPYGGVYHGHDGFLKLLAVVPDYLDIGVFNIEAVLANGNRVVGILNTAAAKTGKPLVVAEESLVRDGKIYRIRVFQYDPTLIV